MEEEEKTTDENVQAEEARKGGLGPVLLVLAVFVLLLGVGLWLGTRGKKTAFENNQVAPTSNLESQEESVSSNQEVKAIEVEAGMFYFKPNEIQVKRGEKVRIILKNVEGVHDFVIDELGVDSGVIQAGQTTEFEFVAEKVGEFEYYCSVANHKAMGMRGTLFVSE